MDKKEILHRKTMDFLDDYLKNTPKEIINKEIQGISAMNFVGTTAQDYFINFNKYYFN